MKFELKRTEKYILDFVRESSGVDLRRYRDEIYSRLLSNRVRVLRVDSLKEYFIFLKENPGEIDRLIESASVGVSSFFRDSLVWENIYELILPKIIERRRVKGRKYFLAWSAGCAKGQEALSIAILLHKILSSDFENWRIHILGTDMSAGDWEKETSRYFSAQELKEVKLGIIEQYFNQKENCYEVLPAVRNMVEFFVEDLTSNARFAPAESVFGGFDLVFCRNVLIYYSSETQEVIVEKLIRSLALGGFLVLGREESLPPGAYSRLSEYDYYNRIYIKSAH